jgi:hypothetical protein
VTPETTIRVELAAAEYTVPLSPESAPHGIAPPAGGEPPPPGPGARPPAAPSPPRPAVSGEWLLEVLRGTPR